MKKYAILVILLLLSTFIFAQTSVTAKEAGKYIGKTISVCDKIFGGIFMSKSSGQPTFLNMGAAYPNAPFTIVIWADARRKFKLKPEEFYRNKQVCITGEIIVFNGKPEMIVTDPTQIIVSEETKK